MAWEVWNNSISRAYRASAPRLVNFPGEKSGLELNDWAAYPDGFPRLQLSAEDREGHGVYRLCFWSYPWGYPWHEIEGYENTFWVALPLTDMERGRFLVALQENMSNRNIVFPDHGALFVGKQAMFMRQPMAYKVGTVLYTFPGESISNKEFGDMLKKGGITGWSPIDAIPGKKLEGGQWVWVMLSSWLVLRANIQHYIDKFLKLPFNVGESVAYGKSYLDQIKNALDKGNDQKRYDKMKAFCTNVDFLERPIGEKNFWDKVLDLVPVVMAGIVTVYTAGLASPYLIAAGSLVATQLKKAGNEKLSRDLQTKLGIAYANENFGENPDETKKVIDQAKSELEEGSAKGKNDFLILGLLAVGVVILFLNKRKKK